MCTSIIYGINDTTKTNLEEPLFYGLLKDLTEYRNASKGCTEGVHWERSCGATFVARGVTQLALFPFTAYYIAEAIVKFALMIVLFIPSLICLPWQSFSESWTVSAMIGSGNALKITALCLTQFFVTNPFYKNSMSHTIGLPEVLQLQRSRHHF